MTLTYTVTMQRTGKIVAVVFEPITADELKNMEHILQVQLDKFEGTNYTCPIPKMPAEEIRHRITFPDNGSGTMTTQMSRDGENWVDVGSCETPDLSFWVEEGNTSKCR